MPVGKFHTLDLIPFRQVFPKEVGTSEFVLFFYPNKMVTIYFALQNNVAPRARTHTFWFQSDRLKFPFFLFIHILNATAEKTNSAFIL